MSPAYNISSLLEGVDDSDNEEIEEGEQTVVTQDSLEQSKKKTGSKTKKGSKKSSTSSKKEGSALSLKGGPGPMSLGAALEKVAGPSLQRKDFGRGIDDNDTFCGIGTVDEKELTKNPLQKNESGSPKKVKTIKRSQIAPVSVSKKNIASLPTAMSGFGSSKTMFSLDDSDGDDEDFYQFENNPFKVPAFST